MTKKYSFPKTERIKSRRIIDNLFDKKSKENKSFLVYPLKVIFKQENELNQKLPEVLISVSKRSFKKAVDRNLVKRRIREAYRTNKIQSEKTLKVAFIYVGKIIEDFQKIEKAMQRIQSHFGNQTADK